jgi:hypothetical protein
MPDEQTPQRQNWFRENQVLVIALVGQAIIGGAYMVNLEARVTTMETRGSPHLEQINTRLTVTEKETEANNKSIERIKDVMMRDLHVPPAQFGK